MRFHEIRRESRANFRSRTSRSLLGVLLLFPLVLGLMIFEVMETTSIERDSLEYLRSGAATYVTELENGISGDACDALAEIPGFIDSGALRTTDTTITLSKLPASSVNVFQATEGFGRVLAGARADTYSTLASAEVATKLGEHGPEFGIDTGDGRIQVSATFQASETPLATGLGWAVVQAANGSQPFDQCWATAWPPTDTHQQLMRQAESIASVGSTDESGEAASTTAQLDTSQGTGYPYGDQFERRPSRFFAPIALLAGAGAAFLVLKLRSLELAALLHDGWTRRQVSNLVLLDNLRWAIIALASALAIAMGLSWPLSPPGDLLTNLSAVLAISLAGAVGVAVGTLTGMLVIKEDRLFDLFKSR